jgi:hypothetical protein
MDIMLARFVAAENINRFRARLEGETDAERKRVLEVLLVEEWAKLAALAPAPARAAA